MPYKIQHRGSGYKVTTPNHPQGFSKHPMSKGKAVAQLRAIKMNTHEELAQDIVTALLDHCGNCPGDDKRVNQAELRKGTKDEEKEHDMPPKKAKKTALQHLLRVDPKYYTKTEKALGEGDITGCCPHCHPPQEGRRGELEQLGWRQAGWGSSTRWTNIPGTYEVYDESIDQLPENEWRYIIKATNARTPEDIDEPAPPSKTLGDYEREREGTVPKADIMPGGSLGTVGGTTNSGASGIGGGL